MEGTTDVGISQPGVRRRPLYGRTIAPLECDEERESLKKVQQKMAEMAVEKAERLQNVMRTLGKTDNKKVVVAFLDALRNAGVTDTHTQDTIIQSVVEMYPEHVAPRDSPPSLLPSCPPELVPIPDNHTASSAPPPPVPAPPYRAEDITLPPPPQKKSGSIETDSHRLHQRYKQVLNGKNTQAYMKAVQITSSKNRPTTPNIYQLCSKRAWDGQLRQWRRLLHGIVDAEAQRERESKDPGPALQQMPAPVQLPPTMVSNQKVFTDPNVSLPVPLYGPPLYQSANGQGVW
eukprot:TRINITY_DN37654_c0_g1_i1.p1 TRINITY_DN37654_c0_g1~~TRINITY_DN37654_c0_g1_i1.p1  ORF type:complete len:289 (+),score=35.67 TRINITY_DN37654_c0_g1_i1:44-910(+)